MKVRIAYFCEAGLDYHDYPEELVDMTEQEFEDAVKDACYHDSDTELYYVNNYDIGYQILEY